MANLIYVDNQGQEATIQCNAQKPVVTIGRNPDRDIKTKDTNVSRAHADVVFESGIYKFVDHNSSNGSYVNDVRIREQVLNDRDVLRCGSFVIRFNLEDAEQQPAAARESTSAFNVDIKDQQAILGELVRIKGLKEQAEAALATQKQQVQQLQMQLGKMQLEIGERERAVQSLTQSLEDKDVLIEQLRAAAAAAGGGEANDMSTRMMDSGAAAFVDKINEQVDALKVENERLHQQLAQAAGAAASTDEVNRLTVANEKLKGENQELRVSLLAAQAAAAVPEHDDAEVDALKQRIAELEQQSDSPAPGDNAELAELQEQNAALHAELEQLRETANDTSEVDDLRSQISALETELESLQSELAEQESAAASDELVALQAQLSAIGEEKTALQSELETLKAELSESKVSAGDQDALLEELKTAQEELRSRPTLADIEDLNYERRELRDELQRVTNALEMAPSVQDFDDLRFQRDQLQDELDARPTHEDKRKWEDAELALKEELDQHKLLLESAPSEVDLDRLQDQVDQLTEQNKQLKADLESAPNQNEIDELKQELDMLIEDRNRFKEEKRILNEKLVQLDERKEIELRDEFDRKMAEKDALIAERESTIASLKQQVHEAEEVIRTANLDEMNELRAFKAEAQEKQQTLADQLAKLQKSTESAIASQQAAEKAMFDQSAEVEDLTRQNADLQREIGEFKQMMVYAPTSEQVEALKDDINQLNKERDQLQKQLDTIGDRHLLAFEQQEKRIAQLTEERDEASVKLRGLEKQLKEIAASGGADPEVVRELKEKNRKATDRVLDLEDKVAELEKDKDLLEQQMRDARSDSADVRVEVGKLQADLRKIQRLFGGSGTADDVEKLYNEFQRLETKHSKLVDEHKLLEEMVADKKLPSAAAPTSSADAEELRDLRRENERLRARVTRSSGDDDSELKARLEKLTDENDVLKSSIRSFERRLARMDESAVPTEEHDQLKKRLDELQAERDRFADKLAEQSSGSGEADQDRKRLTEELAELKQQLDAAKAAASDGSGSESGAGLDTDKLEELSDLYEEVYDLASNWKLSIRLISQYASEIKLGIADLKRDGAGALNKILREFEERELMESLEEKATTAQEDFNQLRDSLRQMRTILDG